MARRRSDRFVGIEEKIDIGSDGGERRPVDYFSSILSKRDMETSSAVFNWKKWGPGFDCHTALVSCDREFKKS